MPAVPTPDRREGVRWPRQPRRPPTSVAGSSFVRDPIRSVAGGGWRRSWWRRRREDGQCDAYGDGEPAQPQSGRDGGLRGPSERHGARGRRRWKVPAVEPTVDELGVAKVDAIDRRDSIRRCGPRRARSSSGPDMVRRVPCGRGGFARAAPRRRPRPPATRRTVVSWSTTRSTSSPVSEPGRLSMRIVPARAATGTAVTARAGPFGDQWLAGEQLRDVDGAEVERRRRAVDGQQLMASQRDLGGERRHDDAVSTDLGDRGREGDDLARTPITRRPDIGAGDRDRHLAGDVDRIECDPAPSVGVGRRNCDRGGAVGSRDRELGDRGEVADRLTELDRRDHVRRRRRDRHGQRRADRSAEGRDPSRRRDRRRWPPSRPHSASR